MKTLTSELEDAIDGYMLGLGTCLLEIYQRIDRDNRDAWQSLKEACRQFDELAQIIDPEVALNLDSTDESEEGSL